MRSILFILFLIILTLSTSSCVSIPKEAPLLSQELKNEIQELENSHLNLVHSFFELKRKNIKNYINKIWLPRFADNYFRQEDISKMWELTINEGSAEDRLQFILITAPELQKQINLQYDNLIEPLNIMENQLEEALREKYSNTKSINNTITSFLVSASKIDENRQRYLDKAGITDDLISRTINKTEQITEKMLNTATALDSGYDEIQKNIMNYKEELNSILNQI